MVTVQNVTTFTVNDNVITINGVPYTAVDDGDASFGYWVLIGTGDIGNGDYPITADCTIEAESGGN